MKSAREVVTLKGWQIATAEGVDGWMAWAKMGQITGKTPIDEPGEHVWFQFGRTREEAFNRLTKELGLS